MDSRGEPGWYPMRASEKCSHLPFGNTSPLSAGLCVQESHLSPPSQDTGQKAGQYDSRFGRQGICKGQEAQRTVLSADLPDWKKGSGLFKLESLFLYGGEVVRQWRSPCKQAWDSGFLLPLTCCWSQARGWEGMGRRRRRGAGHTLLFTLPCLSAFFLS